jgi:hypothetical protein
MTYQPTPRASGHDRGNRVHAEALILAAGRPVDRYLCTASGVPLFLLMPPVAVAVGRRLPRPSPAGSPLPRRVPTATAKWSPLHAVVRGNDHAHGPQGEHVNPGIADEKGHNRCPWPLALSMASVNSETLCQSVANPCVGVPFGYWFTLWCDAAQGQCAPDAVTRAQMSRVHCPCRC